MIVAWVLLLLLVPYLILVGIFIYGYNKVAITKTNSAKAKTNFSIVVPFRDEARHLPALLNSLAKLDYPKECFEILLVDDTSSDASVTIIEQFYLNNPKLQLRLLSNLRRSLSPKKDAIYTAIDAANFDWILTTDADCLVPKKWLSEINACIQEFSPEFIAGPIGLKKTPKASSWLFSFELLDISSLLGATIGAFGINKPIMANGANLAYKKNSFLDVGGFEGNDHRASGDDVFLLEKFVKTRPKKTRYLKSKDATVITSSQERWPELINQRKRWASKAGGYTNAFAKAVGFMVLLGNLSFALLLLLLAFYGLIDLYNTIFQPSFPIVFAFRFNLGVVGSFLILKILLDGLLIYQSLGFMGRRNSVKWYLPVAIVHPFLTAYIALFSLGRSFAWKGRNYEE